jgi:MFS family permease
MGGMPETPTLASHDAAAASREPARGSLLVIFLTVFIDLLGFGMVLPLLPIYGSELQMSKPMIGVLMASFSLMQFLFSPLWGRLSDRIGRRPVLILGLIGSTVFYALFGLATIWRSVTWLFITRIGAGIAGATIPTAQAYIADCTTLANRAKGMALIGAAFGLGFTFGPLLGAAALISAGADQSELSHFSLSESPAAQAAPVPSSEAIKRVATSPWPGFVAAGLSAGALALAIALLPESLRTGSKAAHGGLIQWGALRDALATPTIPALLLTSFVSLLSFSGFEATLSLMLKERFELLHLHHVLLFFAFVGLTLTFAQGFLVRRLAGRVPEVTMAATGAVTTLLGFMLLTWAATSGTLWHFAAATVVEVTGFAMVTPSLQALISRRSDPARQGGIAGLNQSTNALARIAGPVVAMQFFASSPTLPYWASLGIMAVALVLLLAFARGGHDYLAGDSGALPATE